MEQESESFDADEAPVIQPGVSVASGVQGLGPSAASGGAPVVAAPAPYGEPPATVKKTLWGYAYEVKITGQ
jgi:hypothetical protein